MKTTVPVPRTKASDISVLENISWHLHEFRSHHEIVQTLAGKHPYTVTILIELLEPKLRNRKEYVEKTKVPRYSKYKELVHQAFTDEYGERESGERYRKWLDQYRSLFTEEQRQKDLNIVDNYILEHELAPRYKQKILARFKNHTKLFQDRYIIRRERYYKAPEPLQHVDWRNPYDNIFVWEENGQRLARRGGSGSSGGRETNSKFILGLLELNKTQPVPSYLFVYSGRNELLFIKRFDSLCVPAAYDIGANYHQASNEEIGQLQQGGLFLEWDMLEPITEVGVVGHR